jgi:hypothetical protein
MQNFITVPFKSKTNSGFSEVEGFAKFSPAGIVLEFESKFLGFIKSGVKENAIALDRLSDVRFRKGFFKIGAKIEIRLKSFADLAKLPNESGKVVLTIKRDDFDIAREAVERLNRCLEEHRNNLPPAHTPVSVLFDESEAETDRLE